MPLTLENIYYIGQTVAVLAVVVSLVAIYGQMKQQAQLSLFNATKDIMNQFSALQTQLMTDASLRHAIYKTTPLSEEEALQVYMYTATRGAIWATLQWAYDAGQIDDKAFEDIAPDVHLTLAMSPNVADALMKYIQDFPNTDDYRIFAPIREERDKRKMAAQALQAEGLHE
ncbi:MAG: hypothetical protein AAF337_07750 [Pseudomonadota bacterium]